MTRRLWAALSVAALIAAGGLASGGGPAGAAFPGINGLLTFAEGPSGKGTVATVSADGTGQIFPVLLEAGAKPTWSPDGSKIAYTHYTGPHWQIWVMNADGTNPTQVTHVNVGDPGGAATPAWSPDGTKIAYSTSDYDQIWVVNADGSHPAQITHDEGGPVWFPESISWSPDGTKIAYDRNGAEIWVMNADGTNPSKLTEGAHPDWSPDGTKIAYDHQLVIWVMNADGTNRTQITDGTKGSGLDPAWSPDGTKIAFDHACTSRSIRTDLADERGRHRRAPAVRHQQGRTRPGLATDSHVGIPHRIGPVHHDDAGPGIVRAHIDGRDDGIERSQTGNTDHRTANLHRLTTTAKSGHPAGHLMTTAYPRPSHRVCLPAGEPPVSLLTRCHGRIPVWFSRPLSLVSFD